MRMAIRPMPTRRTPYAIGPKHVPLLRCAPSPRTLNYWRHSEYPISLRWPSIRLQPSHTISASIEHASLRSSGRSVGPTSASTAYATDRTLTPLVPSCLRGSPIWRHPALGPRRASPHLIPEQRPKRPLVHAAFIQVAYDVGEIGGGGAARHACSRLAWRIGPSPPTRGPRGLGRGPCGNGRFCPGAGHPRGYGARWKPVGTRIK